jgi:hypothetical protein
MSPRSRKHALPKPDSRGRIRPYVGYRADGKKARILVGNIKQDGQAEIERRLSLIRQLYDKHCERSGRERWANWVWRVAQRIGNGEPITDKFLDKISNSVTAAGMVAQLRQWGIPVEVGEIYEQGLQMFRQQIESRIAGLVQMEMSELGRFSGAIADEVVLPHDPLTMTESASFYDSLDAFKQHLEATGAKNDAGKFTNYVYSRLALIKTIKMHTEDFPLRTLTTPKWQSIISTWTNRPQTQRGNRGSKDWVNDVIKLLKKYAKWLHIDPQFKWKKPDGFDDVDSKVVALPSDTKMEAFQTISVPTYSPEELALICLNTDYFWRTIIATCVNCAFGQSEIGQWSTRNIRLHQEHPHAGKIGWDTSPTDSWMAGPRPKTGCYGEHLLWPEVAMAIEHLLKDGRPVLAITRTGKPMWMEHSKRPQSQIDNRWNRLIDKIIESQSGFPKYPFGRLRDTLPNLLRQRYSDDIASLALQHGTYADDKLLKCYANLPFAKLFEATRGLRDHFRPMLDTLKT